MSGQNLNVNNQTTIIFCRIQRCN